MSRDIVTAREGDSLSSVMDAMLMREISHVPVLDAAHELIGMVSKTDIVSDRLIRGDTHEEGRPSRRMRRGITYPLGEGFHLEVSPDITVDEVMRAGVVSIADTATVAQAAALMTSHRLHGLPVISKKRGLVGFVSSLDITRWVARS